MVLSYKENLYFLELGHQCNSIDPHSKHLIKAFIFSVVRLVWLWSRRWIIHKVQLNYIRLWLHIELQGFLQKVMKLILFGTQRRLHRTVQPFSNMYSLIPSTKHTNCMLTKVTAKRCPAFFSQRQQNRTCWSCKSAGCELHIRWAFWQKTQPKSFPEPWQRMDGRLVVGSLSHTRTNSILFRYYCCKWMQWVTRTTCSSEVQT